MGTRTLVRHAVEAELASLRELVVVGCVERVEDLGRKLELRRADRDDLAEREAHSVDGRCLHLEFAPVRADDAVARRERVREAVFAEPGRIG